MALSAEQFKEIIESLRSDSPANGSFEKRASPRVGLRTKLTIYPSGDTQKGFAVWVRDLSATGIGIVHSEPLQSGMEFLVRFPLRATEHLSAYYTVMHCRMISRNLWFTGARLKQIVEK